MSELTKEWLVKTIMELEEERDAVPGAVNEDAANALAAMKLALASLEAEPVAVVAISNGGYDKGEKVINYFQDEIQHLPEGSVLYTSPPAPVSVPDAYTRDERGRMMLNGKPEPRIGYGGGWNACRAAMLQGAEQTNYRAIVERIAEIIHGKVTDIDLLTVTVKSMKDKLQK